MAKFSLVAELQLRGVKGVNPAINQIQKKLNSLKSNINLKVSASGKKNIQDLNKELLKANRNAIKLQNTLSKLGTTKLNSNINSLNKSLGNTTKQLNSVLSVAQQIANLKIKGLGGLGQQAQQSQKAIQSTNSALQTTTNSTVKLGQQAALAIKRFSAFTIVTSTLFTLGAGIRSAVKNVIDFQHGFVRLSQISGKTVSNLKDIRDEITNLSTNLGVSSSELLSISDTLLQAGLNANDTRDALEALALTKLAPTFGDIEDTVEGAIAAMQQFNIPAQKLKETLGSVNAVSAGFAVESEDLTAAVRRAGAAFAASGGDLNQFIALFTSVRQTTRESAETIATGFRTIFTRLQRPKTLDFLKQLGIELTNSEGLFVGPYEAIRRLNSALAEIEGNDPRFAKIVEELGGFRQVSKVIPLLQQFAVAENALGVAIRGSTSLTKDAETAQQSLLTQITKLEEKFFELFRTIGDNSTIKDFASVLGIIAEGAIQVTNALTPLIPLLLTVSAIKLGSAAAGFTKGFSQGLRKTSRFANGGIVPGVGNGDTVPALLTPGEYVVDKDTAQSIGYDNLKKLKIQKYNKGGKVQRFASGGTVKGNPGGGNLNSNIFGALLFSIPILAKSFEGLTSELSRTTLELTSTGLLALTVGKSFTDLKTSTGKLKKLSDVQSTAQERVTKSQNEYNKNLDNAKSKLRDLIAATGKRNEIIARREYNAAAKISNSSFRDRNNALSDLKIANKANNRFNRLKIGLGDSGLIGGLSAAGGIITTSLASKIGDKAKKNIEEGAGTEQDIKDTQTATRLGNVGTFASSGAFIGSFLSPLFGPLSAAAGGLIGAAVGLFLDTTDEVESAKKRIAAINFTKSFEDLSKTLQAAGAGQLDLKLKGGNLARNLNALQNSIFAVSSTDEQKQRINEAQNQIGNLQNLGNLIAASAKDIDEFKKSSEGLGQQVITLLAQLSGLPIQEVEEQFNNLIKSSQNAVKLQERFAEFSKSTFDAVRAANDFSRSIARASNAVAAFSNVASLISNNFEGVSFNSNASNVIKQGLNANANEFEGSARNIFKGAGANTSNLVSNVTASVRAAQKLPEVLINAFNAGELDAGGLEGNIEKGLQDFPAELRNIILQNVVDLLNDDSGVNKFNEKVSQNVTKFAQELTDNFSEITDSLADAAKVAEDESQRIIDLIQARGRIESNLTDISLKVAFAEERIARQASALGNTEKFIQGSDATAADILKSRRSSQSVRFRGFGDLNGNSTISQIGIAGIARQNNLAALQAQINTSSALDDSFKALIETADTASREYQNIIQSLEEQATNTDRLVALEKELADAESKRLARNSLLTDLQSREGIRSFNKGAVSASVLAAAPGTIGSEDNINAAFAFLDRLKELGAGDTALSAFSGKTANQVRNENNAAVLSKITGISFKEALEKVTAPPEEIKLQNDILNEQRNMVTAQKALAILEENKFDLLNSTIETGFETLGSKFEESNIEAVLQREQNSLQQTKLKNQSSLSQSQAVSNLQSIGIDLTTAEAINKQSGKFRELQKLKEQEQLLKEIEAGGAGFFSTAGVTNQLTEKQKLGVRGSFGVAASNSFGRLRNFFDPQVFDSLLNSSINNIASAATTNGNTKAQIDKVIQDEFKKIISAANIRNTSQQSSIKADLSNNLGAGTTNFVSSSPSVLGEVLKNVDTIGGLSESQINENLAKYQKILNEQQVIIDNLTNRLENVRNTQSNKVNARRDALQKRRLEQEERLRQLPEYKAGGGIVGRPRGTDTIPAMLTKGEYIVDAKTAKKIGYDNLDSMKYMAGGGIVGLDEEIASIRSSGINNKNRQRLQQLVRQRNELIKQERVSNSQQSISSQQNTRNQELALKGQEIAARRREALEASNAAGIARNKAKEEQKLQTARNTVSGLFKPQTDRDFFDSLKPVTSANSISVTQPTGRQALPALRSGALDPFNPFKQTPKIPSLIDEQYSNNRNVTTNMQRFLSRNTFNDIGGFRGDFNNTVKPAPSNNGFFGNSQNKPFNSFFQNDNASVSNVGDNIGKSIMSAITNGANVLTQSLEIIKGIPKEITMNTRVEPIQVSITGAEGLSKLQQGIQDWIGEVVDAKLKSHGVSLGPKQPMSTSQPKPQGK